MRRWRAARRSRCATRAATRHCCWPSSWSGCGSSTSCSLLALRRSRATARASPPSRRQCSCRAGWVSTRTTPCCARCSLRPGPGRRSDSRRSASSCSQFPTSTWRSTGSSPPGCPSSHACCHPTWCACASAAAPYASTRRCAASRPSRSSGRAARSPRCCRGARRGRAGCTCSITRRRRRGASRSASSLPLPPRSQSPRCRRGKRTTSQLRNPWF
mmetsp:Transcript_10912/g.27537  ORF Transcript_10912/g.27537 Transcript_10912/m.27537 type:complete len:215 (-) Transcript_10912:1867-2511(-)